MPRPSTGYRNQAGEKVPGTTDITKRFMPSGGLVWWAFRNGQKGLSDPYDDQRAINIGTAVHTMAEEDMKGQRTQADIDEYATIQLRDPEDLEKARASYRLFREWRSEFRVRAYAQEVSIVSELYQFGGTLDSVLTIRKGLGLLDIKTSNKAEVYICHLLQLAAYGLLWEEAHPQEPLTEGYHLIVLPKDGSRFIHKEYSPDHIKPYREMFLKLREAYALDVICNNPKALRGGEIAPSLGINEKPRFRVKAQTMQPATIGEMLRAYGHIEGVPT